MLLPDILHVSVGVCIIQRWWSKTPWALIQKEQGAHTAFYTMKRWSEITAKFDNSVLLPTLFQDTCFFLFFPSDFSQSKIVLWYKRLLCQKRGQCCVCYYLGGTKSQQASYCVALMRRREYFNSGQCFFFFSYRTTTTATTKHRRGKLGSFLASKQQASLLFLLIVSLYHLFWHALCRTVTPLSAFSYFSRGPP